MQYLYFECIWKILHLSISLTHLHSSCTNFTVGKASKSSNHLANALAFLLFSPVAQNWLCQFMANIAVTLCSLRESQGKRHWTQPRVSFPTDGCFFLFLKILFIFLSRIDSVLIGRPAESVELKAGNLTRSLKFMHRKRKRRRRRADTQSRCFSRPPDDDDGPPWWLRASCQTPLPTAHPFVAQSLATQAAWQTGRKCHSNWPQNWKWWHAHTVALPCISKQLDGKCRRRGVYRLHREKNIFIAHIYEKINDKMYYQYNLINHIMP